MSNESDEVTINCVVFFYEEGKGGENFRRKNKFRCKVNKNATACFTENSLTDKQNQLLFIIFSKSFQSTDFTLILNK
jgi:hypothetical protein